MQVVEAGVQCELFNLEEVPCEIGRTGIVEVFIILVRDCQASVLW